MNQTVPLCAVCRNDEVRRTTKQPHISAIVQARRFSLFGHIARVSGETDANKILKASHLQMNEWHTQPTKLN